LRKAIYIFVILVFALACKQEQPTLKKESIPSKEKFGEEELTICKEQSKNGIRFETCLKQYDLFTLKSQNGDILYKNDNNPSEYVFTDFNEDGFFDIELHFMTNVPGVHEILIFNPDSKSFKEIENFSSFPASLKIKGADLFYSYHRSGCADNDWGSDLFSLKDNKAVKMGTIKAIECANQHDNGIYFYKVIGEKKQLIEHRTIKEKGFDNKWVFIKKYWTENYVKFK
jgi:hypothetical protein